MKKAIQHARSKRNWAKMFGVAAVFTVCLLNLQVSFSDKSGDVSLASLSVTSQQVSATEGTDSGFWCCTGWGRPCGVICLSVPGQTQKF